MPGVGVNVGKTKVSIVIVGMGSSLMATGWLPRTDSTSAPKTVAAMTTPMNNPLERLLIPRIDDAYS
jgi:hypothetical protein